MNYIEERPWGSFEVFEADQHYKFKKLIVKPGQRLSLQMHMMRTEFWSIISGSALVTIDDIETEGYIGSTFLIRTCTKHRIENISDDQDLIFVELATSPVLVTEDDIIRYEDDYGRQVE